MNPHLSRPEGSRIRRGLPCLTPCFRRSFRIVRSSSNQGEFRFNLTGASLFAAVLAAVAAGLAVFTYRRVGVTQGRPGIA